MKRTNRLAAAAGIVVALAFAAAALWIMASPKPDSSRLERLAWLATIMTVMVGIPSVLFLLEQVRDLKSSLRSTAFEATAARIGNLTDLFLSHPDEYVALRSGPSTVRSELLAERVLDIMDTEILLHSAGLAPAGPALPSIEPWFRDLFVELEGLRSVLDKRREWYSRELWNLRPEADEQEHG